MRIHLEIPVMTGLRLSRFMNKVSVDASTGCWNWIGCLMKNGYGQVGFNPRRYLVHRVSYRTFVGPIPQGLEIDHLCRNRKCVNPAHLEAVTPRENQRRSDSVASIQARKTHCKHGHPFSGDNLMLEPYKYGVHRRCMTCRKAHWARMCEKQRAHRAEARKQVKP